MATAPINIDIVRIVDELGQLKAQIADLDARKKELEATLKVHGAGAYDGTLYRATVSETSASYSLDAKAAEAKLRELGVDGRWFSKHQKERKASIAVRVVSRKN